MNHPTNQCGTIGPLCPRQRRGFVFVMVLALIGVATITLASAIRRATLQGQLAQMQIEGYERHHEMQGVKALVQMYLFRQDAQDLRDLASSGTPVQTIRFDNAKTIRLYVQDGQGTVLRNLMEVDDAEGQRFLEATLSRLPPGRLDLTRLSGPWKVSLAAAPDEVLVAIAGDDPSLASALIAARDEEVGNTGEMLQMLDSHGVETVTAQAVSRNLDFEPFVWRIDVEVIDRRGDRYYSTMASRRGNLPRILEWHTLNRSDEVLGFGPLAGHPERANVVRRPPNNRIR